MGSVQDVFRNPQHPYLKALLKASPHFEMEEGERLVKPGRGLPPKSRCKARAVISGIADQAGDSLPQDDRRGFLEEERGQAGSARPVAVQFQKLAVELFRGDGW